MSSTVTSRAAPSSILPHWSDTSSPRERVRPSSVVAAVLRDLTSWWADLAIVLTHNHPEDRTAIDRVRHFAFAWLAGEPLPELSIDELLTTVAALMAGIDRSVGGTSILFTDDDERHAIGAVLVA